MLRRLEQFLPDDGGSNPVPASSVSVDSATERALAIGNRRGMEPRGSFPLSALKGIHLDAVVRFELWDEDRDAVLAKTTQLHSNLHDARDELWADGFLRIAAEGTSVAEHVSSLNAWRQTADYGILYEYRYEDTDGADSLIARIPIAIDGEVADLTVVTDQMVRWDDLAAPALEISGQAHRAFHVGSISMLAHLPEAWNGVAVTLSASVGGVLREQAFASVREFVEAFDLEMEQVAGEEKPRTTELGGNPHIAGRMAFPNADWPEPLWLKGGEDRFQIRYGQDRFHGEPGDETDAVVYLRVLS